MCAKLAVAPQRYYTARSMRRLILLLAVAGLVAGGIWLALRGGGTDANTRVAALLPADTLAYAHVPDFRRAREQWRETDIYKLWREPAVQEFLQKPLATMPPRGSIEERLQQLERIGVRDAFVAVTSWDNEQFALVGGFRFKGSKGDAEKVVAEWRARVMPDAGAETVQHQRHRLDITRGGGATLATVFADDWFFAANDVAALTALLDRANSRTTDASATLATDSTFGAALKRRPAIYAAFAYARPDEFAARVAARLPDDESNAQRLAILRQMRSISAATTFDRGKIRDVLFVAMPKAADTADLTRSSLALGTGETFLYLATLLSFPRDVAIPNNPPPLPRAGFGAGMQTLVARLAASGITLDDWKAAFGDELGIIGDWPANARIPALLASLPVKDAARADQIVATMTDATVDERWVVSERDGVRFYSQRADNPLVPVAPTLALSSDRAIVGLDQASVQAAVRRAAGGGESPLAASAGFQSAEASVQTPRQSFTYIDTALLYGRLDAALRPMLIMGAAFVPAIAQAITLSKVPDAEVITRHLSPIVVSQTYEEDGYLTESVGPFSIYHAAIGIAGATGAGARWYRANMPAPGLVNPTLSPFTAPAASPSPDDAP